MDWKKIWAWCKDEDWIVIAVPAFILSILLSLFCLWYWFWLLIIILVTVLAIEAIATHLTGLSISDQFRTWKKKNVRASWLILIAMALFFASILFHLMVNIP